MGACRRRGVLLFFVFLVFFVFSVFCVFLVFLVFCVFFVFLVFLVFRFTTLRVAKGRGATMCWNQVPTTYNKQFQSEKQNSSIRLHALSLKQQDSLVRKTEQRGTLTQQQRPSDDLDPFHGNRPIPNNRGIRQRCRPSNNSASIQCDLRTRPT